MSLKSIIFPSSPADRELAIRLAQIIHFTPKRIYLYKCALSHASIFESEEDIGENNERLEFLGDAFLGSIVGAYLFKKYPKKKEGFLTELRSKIVSRDSLNKLSIDIGLDKVLRYNKNDVNLRSTHIFGNALEALIGAIYLDKGFKATEQFIVKILLKRYLDIDELAEKEINFKKRIYHWAQVHHRTLTFVDLPTHYVGKRKIFEVEIFVDNHSFTKGTGWNKKEASQKAAEQALALIEQGQEQHGSTITTPED